ncbi:hypothetical protein NEOLEDRAFT_892119 [Neolentinus lepideus HHB14362 ss-1]|uniref:Uncharacterized protein n=1 Tax=Neolentinus lepideus HHB14362 ss-1 TaxID=1314782 RepID=A0A165NTM2_9AGAM|nr:hypothetical protein NEOLEDRAFT_892119 [Neolentinus lepideus HHB14362 ss-1]
MPGPPRKAVNECFELGPNGKFHCKICRPYNNSKQFGRTGLDSHLLSQDHATSTRLQQERARKQRKTDAEEAMYKARWAAASLASWSAPQCTTPKPSTHLAGDAILGDFRDEDIVISIGATPINQARKHILREYDEFRLGTALRMVKSLGIGLDSLSCAPECEDEEIVNSTLTNVMDSHGKLLAILSVGMY